jgi:hypothetical protein
MRTAAPARWEIHTHPGTATFLILGTVPFVVVPRCTVVTAANSPKRLDALENCMTRANAAGSVAFAVHWQSTEVEATTFVVGTESEMPATRWLSDNPEDRGCTCSAIPSNFMRSRTEVGRYACVCQRVRRKGNVEMIFCGCPANPAASQPID